MDLESLAPEQHLERYLALKAAAAARASATRGSAVVLDVTPPATALRELVPDGSCAALRVARGRMLRLATPTGRAAASAVIWCAADTSERLNVADSMKIQWRATLGAGDLLLSDMGRVLASIVADSGAGHDALIGCADAASTAARYGRTDLRNSRDNFCLGAAKLGLDRRDVMPCVTFFAPIETLPDGGFRWRAPGPPPGSYVTLRAEMDLLMVLSNCPHPLDPHPDFAPGPVEALVWDAPPAAIDDGPRNGGEEARRAFERTDAYLSGILI